MPEPTQPSYTYTVYTAERETRPVLIQSKQYKPSWINIPHTCHYVIGLKILISESLIT